MQSSLHRSKASITVSELNRQAKSLLEHSFSSVRVSGEISNLARPSSGHWYFTLKDAGAQVRCAMFRGNNVRVGFKPKDGDQVVVRARVSLYEGRGDFQLICETLEKDGLGQLQQAFEALKQKLSEEGLFAPERKRAIPARPKVVGVITSESGAAIHDILTVLKRRYPSLSIILYPTAVQGQEAVPGIVAALDQAARHGEAEVLILGRGGGSLEDLWAFNEEAVARAVIASPIPVISAVGHEVDFSISDFVADARAATPSAAAEMISPDQKAILAQLKQYERGLVQRWRVLRSRRAEQLSALSSRLRHPGERLRERIQTVDRLELRLDGAFKRYLKQQNQALQQLSGRLNQTRPDRQIALKRVNLAQLKQRLQAISLQSLERRKLELGRQIARLNAISPLATLERGYALITDDQNRVVRYSHQVQSGSELNIRLQQGKIRAEVKDTDENE